MLVGGAADTESLYLSSFLLTVEYVHVTSEERAQVVELYQNPAGIRYLVPDQQYFQGYIIPQATLLSSSTPLSILLQNITQPVHSFFISFRWVQDVTRVKGATGAGNAVGGRNIWNVGVSILV